MENYILRKYENFDYEFVYEVKKNAYKKYVEQCWGKWDDIDQKNRFKESMEKTFDRTYIIMFNDEKIGFYQGQVVNERTYYIENICIIPEYQGKGIGTEILKSVLNKYSDKNIEIHYVCVDNETWKININERNKRIDEGKGGSDFYLDEGLLKKLESRWEEPTEDEIDFIYNVKRG